jgi:hypothetical protein
MVADWRQAMTDAAVVAEGLGKRFGPVMALDGVDLELATGWNWSPRPARTSAGSRTRWPRSAPLRNLFVVGLMTALARRSGSGSTPGQAPPWPPWRSRSRPAWRSPGSTCCSGWRSETRSRPGWPALEAAAWLLGLLAVTIPATTSYRRAAST